MIPAPFEYERAESIDHALELLERGGMDARPLAGGHSLLPLMRLRLARPTMLVDLGGLEELKTIRVEGDAVRIGAMCTHRALAEADLDGGARLIARVAEQIGDPQVRHCGTIGGSIAHADPASDLPAALLALEAEIVVHGPDGTRSIPAPDFFLGPFMSALGAIEIVTEIVAPRRAGAGTAYSKFQRRAQDWAIVGVAAVIGSEGDAIASAAIGLTNMGGTPVRAAAVEEALVGATDDAGIRSAAARVRELEPPPGDESASSEYRMHLAEVLIRRAVAAARA